MLLTLARPSEKGKECFVVIKCALVICGAGGAALKGAGMSDSELSSGRLKGFRRHLCGMRTITLCF